MIIEVTAHISSSSRKIEVCFNPATGDPDDSRFLTIDEATGLRDELSKRLTMMEDGTTQSRDRDGS